MSASDSRRERENTRARAKTKTQLVVLLRGLAVLHDFGADVFSLSVPIPDDGRLFPTRSSPALVRVGLEVLQDFRLTEREARVLVLVVVRDDDVLDLREICRT
jgi:hypothetical protein